MFENDSLYRLSVYVVTDSFIGDSGKVQVLYLYKNGDSTVVAFDMDIPDGDNARTGYTCLTDTFTYDPNLAPGHAFIGCRVEVHQGSGGSGDSVIVDNFLLDREYTEAVWHDYDTTYSDWALISGDGEKIIWAEFRDAAGNVASAVSDTVILDETLPVDTITSPQGFQTVSDTVTIKGWAHDSATAVQHFYYYKLEYKLIPSGSWNDCDTLNPYYYVPQYPDTNPFSPGPSVELGKWYTNGLINNRYYFLKLTVVDSASNVSSTQIVVYVSNGGKGGSGEFMAGENPTGIGLLSRFYITDENDGKAKKYNAVGDSIGCFALLQDSLGKNSPIAIETDSNEIWVTDKHNHSITCYDTTGDTIVTFGGHGSDPGLFKEPSGIALLHGKVYVTDRNNHRVQVFRADSFLFGFGSKGDSIGQFNEPTGIAINTSGIVFVSDSKNNRIQAFDTLGNFIGLFGEEGLFNRPNGIHIDNHGYVFVIDMGNDRILELDPSGSPIYKMGEKGSGFGKFLCPHDLTTSSDGNELLVTDYDQGKVIEFNIYVTDTGGPMSSGEEELPTINCMKACYPVPFSKGTNISYAIVNKRHVSIKVYDITGRLIKKLVHGTQDRGWYTIQWNGYNQNAKSVAAGVYFIRMETGSFLSTKKVLLVR